ncbi:hypothetical protein FC26_GL000157 [Paucilactobacillus vaccinostercus DSM 20634]|jgi:regulatory protein YycI of two-component signal transduction system YycFG|uniref:Regulatory protein YycH-like domain-containing protein n=1 Tax=Paucilactobacillus vaccinostercus DSM 20634 TaxID=1423813 RepID=A0A0R2AA93_9LACO|nr:two-component system regulatory protein YycI [Paucilactobacillus vaccinostercus]KRM60681.1 hypothetical protein FC26_GL000157 [Paucilactobacillus vaccinostercus DSM 20634]RRG11040.1 MAG: hypothetical protein DUD32_03645 [Lactobacillus sp.]
MNFRRIQWIFLVAFIAIDIFLGVSLASDKPFTVTNKSASQEETILKEMNDDSISIGTLSTKHASGYYIASSGSGILQTKMSQLKNQTTSYSDGELNSTFNSTIKIDPKNPQKVLDKVVKNQNRVLFGTHYVYDERLSAEKDNSVVYVQKGPDLHVLSDDGQLRFKVRNHNLVTGYTQTYLNGIQTLREEETTISQKKAVIWLYQHNEIPNNSKIKWAKLGYVKLLSAKGSNVYIPTWVIGIQTKNTEGTQIRQINAFTGTLIKANSNLLNESSAK